MNTLSQTVIFEGVGIHSGNPVRMMILPSQNPGISFTFNKQVIKVSVASIGMSHVRSTTLTNGVATIQTPEHFLAACYALNLSNILIDLDAPELPILDGSSIDYINKLMPYLTPIPNQDKQLLAILKEEEIKINQSHYMIMPSDAFTISVVLSYPNHWIKSMSFSYTHSQEAFINQIASARTYGFTHEIDELKKNGLAKGGGLDNALLISDDGYVNKPRFVDELPRHKILDFIGDMSIHGRMIKGNFVLIRPSHFGNCELLKKLAIG